MMNFQRSPLVSVHKLKGGCPVCGKSDWCSVSEDRRIAFCRRVESDKPGRGGWTHILTSGASAIFDKVKPAPARSCIERAPLEHCDGIYCRLLRERLTLKPEHRAQLRARGLSDAEIDRNLYRSAPTEAEAQRIADALAPFGLSGVPGFYRDGPRWRMARTSGFFIPHRNARGQIEAMQYRPDATPTKGGKYRWFSKADACSSGAPPHFAYGHLLADAREVMVTEGGLKADLIAFFTQSPVVGIAGVATFKEDFGELLRREAPSLRTVLVAFDRDLITKPEVFKALERLAALLTRSRFRVRVRRGRERRRALTIICWSNHRRVWLPDVCRASL